MSTINIIDGQTYRLSPAEKTFNVLKSGNPTFAELNISFVESFGYALKEAFFNGVRLPAQSGSSLKASVIPHLKNGENKLVVIFDALQIFGQPLGQTQISATLTITGATVAELPSPTQFFDDIGNGLKQNAPVIIGVIVAGAVALSALAFTTSRLPNLGGIKVSNDTLKSISKKASSSLKTVRQKVSV